MSLELVLSLFPGLDVLGLAFERVGYAVVRGPDLIWGTDVRTFHVPSGRFEGVIGGPPCQAYSQLRHLNPLAGRHGDMIPEFIRVVEEAQPRWFVMENVKAAPAPVVPGYVVTSQLLNNRRLPDADGIGAEQNRIRRISFGSREGLRLPLVLAALESPQREVAVVCRSEAVPVRIGGSGKLKRRIVAEHAVTGGHDDLTLHDRGLPMRTVERMLELQGLPPTYLDESPLTLQGKRKLIGNAVPLPMGLAIARAVRAASAREGAAG